MLERILIVTVLMAGLAAPAAAQTVIDMPPPPPSSETAAPAVDAAVDADLGSLALARYARSSGPRSYSGTTVRTVRAGTTATDTPITSTTGIRAITAT
jgi:hypothetical protein